MELNLNIEGFIGGSLLAGGGAAWTPAQLGVKLKGWYESDGLIDDATNSYGIVASGRVTQWSDRSGNNNHYIVASGANAPSLSSGRLNFLKTNSESLISDGLLSDIVADTQGEVIQVIKKTAGENCNAFCASHPSNIDKRCAFAIRDTDDKSLILMKNDDSPLDVNSILGDTFSDTQFATISYSSNGTVYKIVHEKNGERSEDTLTINAGSNDGRWWGDVSPENFSLFSLRDSSPVFYTGGIYALFVFDQQLTVQERSDMFCYLNNIYNVWP